MSLGTTLFLSDSADSAAFARNCSAVNIGSSCNDWGQSVSHGVGEEGSAWPCTTRRLIASIQPARTSVEFLKRYCPSRQHHRSHRREQNFRTSLFWATLGQATACLLSHNLGASGMKHNSRPRN